MRGSIVVAVLSALVMPGAAWAVQVEDVSDLIAPIIAKRDVPAMVAAIVEADRVSHAGAAGVRRRGSDARVTLEDRFHIGSCTKAMTATLCALLVQEGRLQWSRTLAESFPELAATMHADYRAVTLEQLLTHRAGAPADLTAGGLWQRLWENSGTAMGARRMLLEGVVKNPPEARPGDSFIYSNAGYAIAGHTAETVMQRPWEELVRERLFAPLGMSSAGFGAPGEAGKLDHPWGHTSDGKPIAPGPAADNPPAIGPAGTVHCSIGDWAHFVSLHLGAGERKLLQAQTLRKLHTPAAGPGESYAMGWLVTRRQWGGGDVLTHAGSNTMWYAVAWVAPKRNFAVLVACNQGGRSAERACDDAAGALIERYLGGR